MLRHKLFMVLGALLAILVVTALGAIVALQMILQQMNHVHPAQFEHAAVVERFRWVVIVLTVVFILVINASVILLVRAGNMVLEPVEKLIEATHALGEGHLDYRVNIAQQDEFAELAESYNALAARLAADERMRLETLGQVATTLNHELNNVLSIIEMQLQLLSRKSGEVAGVQKYAGQIRASLARMAGTLEALKHVRRIVLTDYTSGVKMLDLARSVRDEDEPAPAELVFPHANESGRQQVALAGASGH